MDTEDQCRQVVWGGAMTTQRTPQYWQGCKPSKLTVSASFLLQVYLQKKSYYQMISLPINFPAATLASLL